MSRHATRYNKRDANELAIIAALAKMGVAWVEAGPLDGWIFLGHWIPVEVKTKEGTLTAGQKAFIEGCQRDGKPYRIWRSADDAMEFVQVYYEARGGWGH